MLPIQESEDPPLSINEDSRQDRSNFAVTVILPIFNEEGNVVELYQRLCTTFQTFFDEGKGIEFLFVDDGSTDSSVSIILSLRDKDPRIKLLNLSRNFGHQAAITAGIDYSVGDAVILMDADLQDPPEVLPDMLTEWKNGADVVFAVRQHRKESVWKRSSYFLFYRILQKISNIDIPLDSGDFCLMDRRVVDLIKRMPERNRFLRGLRSWVGFNQVSMPYERYARLSGKTKYTFGKLVKLALSGILSFSSLPLRLATYFGFIVCLSGFLYVVYAVMMYFLVGQAPQGWTSLVVVVLFLGGVQLLILGAIGEYIALIHDEVKQRPTYLVSDYWE